MDRKPRLLLLCCAVTAALAVAGCGSTGQPTPGPTTAPSASSAAPSASGSPGAPATATPTGGATGPSSPGGGSSRPVDVTFSANGTSVSLHVGQRLHVELVSPFWTFQPAGSPQLLRTDATGVASPSAGCPPPMGTAGCGEDTADYTAVSTGRTSVTATRTICGEAMQCTGANARFELKVTVTP